MKRFQEILDNITMLVGTVFMLCLALFGIAFVALIFVGVLTGNLPPSTSRPPQSSADAPLALPLCTQEKKE